MEREKKGCNEEGNLFLTKKAGPSALSDPAFETIMLYLN
jgi:hypothetical protein